MTPYTRGHLLIAALLSLALGAGLGYLLICGL